MATTLLIAFKNFSIVTIRFQELYNFEQELAQAPPNWYKPKEVITFQEFRLDFHDTATYLDFLPVGVSLAAFFPKKSFGLRTFLPWVKLSSHALEMAIFQELIRGNFTLYCKKYRTTYFGRFPNDRIDFYLEANQVNRQNSSWLNDKVLDGVIREKGKKTLKRQVKGMISRMIGFTTTYSQPHKELLLQILKRSSGQDTRYMLITKTNFIGIENQFSLIMNEDILARGHQEYTELNQLYKAMASQNFFSIFQKRLNTIIKNELRRRTGGNS